jgi:hypothetical protein
MSADDWKNVALVSLSVSCILSALARRWDRRECRCCDE